MMKGEMDTALIGVVIGHRDGEAMKGDDPRVLIVERGVVLIMAVDAAQVPTEESGPALIMDVVLI